MGRPNSGDGSSGSGRVVFGVSISSAAPSVLGEDVVSLFSGAPTCRADTLKLCSFEPEEVERVCMKNPVLKPLARENCSRMENADPDGKSYDKISI